MTQPMDLLGFEAMLFVALLSLLFSLGGLVEYRIAWPTRAMHLLSLGWALVSLAFALFAIGAGQAPLIERSLIVPYGYLLLVVGFAVVACGKLWVLRATNERLRALKGLNELSSGLTPPPSARTRPRWPPRRGEEC